LLVKQNKMTSVNRVYIDTRDRVSGTSSDFCVRLGNNQALNNARGISLVEAIVPLTYHTVQSGRNNILYGGVRTYGDGLVDSAGSRGTIAQENPWQAVIPEGNYTTDQLLVQLKSSVDAAVASAYPSLTALGSVWSYSELVSRFTTSSTSFYYNFRDSNEHFWDLYMIWDENMLLANLPSIDFRDTMNSLLGMQSLTYPATAIADSPINSYPWSSNVVHGLTGYDYLYIMLDIVHDGASSSTNSNASSILAKIPLNSYASEIHYFSQGSPPIIAELKNNSIEVVRVRLVDHRFRVIDLNGGESSFTLAVHR
jgi:hypothetical protein